MSELEALRKVAEAARECEYQYTNAEESLGPPQQAAWDKLWIEMIKLREALAALAAARREPGGRGMTDATDSAGRGREGG